jgi:hypothetical protein
MLRVWAKEANKLNMAFMPVINWWTVNDIQYFTGYKKVISDTGTTLDNTPCPYSKEFWDKWVTPRLVAVCQVVDGQRLTSVLVDTEMYGTEYSGYYRQCYCDECYSRYLKARGQTGDLPPIADRGAIIKNAGEIEEYKAVQREAAYQHAAGCRKALQKIQPKLRIGVLDLDRDNSFQQGLALGFGTSTLPVFCLSESTYQNGYTSYIATAEKSFQDLGAHVDMLVGIWQSKFPQENIAEQLYYCAHDTYGYWIYTMETFDNPAYSPFPGTAEAQWAAIKQANLELDELSKNQNYQTTLKIRDFTPPPEPLSWDGFKAYNYTQNPASSTLSLPVARLRGLNWLYFFAKKMMLSNLR